ncbi:MAG: SpoIIE family protein phosphatase, partial [Gemmatimonadota bacterium]|nr:SpoIIE family protein phosphatase [Gemmatimonadota bacterium]
MKKAQYKILVVDDEPDLEHLVRQRMRRDVRAGHYEFVFAYNGVEALEVLNADPDIDMVLSDINMPRMDGLTLLEQMSQVDPDLRAVIVSAYGDMKNIRTAMNRGAFDFVTKPIDFQDLRVTIERTLEHLQMWREAVASRDKLVALQNELRVAHEMQQSILPKIFPNKPGYQIFGNMEPAREVGGDFFDIINLENNCVGLAIADVSDKGVPAALFMMSSRTLMKGAAIGRSSPAEVLSEVNNLLQEDNDAAMFVTVFYAEYNPGSGVLSYANGGHNPPIVVHADGSSTVLPQTNGIALGIMPDIKYEQNSVTLSPGDALVLYTDGVTEAMNA